VQIMHELRDGTQQTGDISVACGVESAFFVGS
jgi:hypothetical protein